MIMKILRFLLFFLILNFSNSLTTLANWKDEVSELNVGLLGGENEADRLKNNECWRKYLEKKLNIPINFFPASDYAGVIHGLLGKTLDYASIGASGYAAIYIEQPNAVEPLITIRELDGSIGYKSAMYVRKDSGIYSIEDMEGKSIAWADPNSTSGYLVPFFELTKNGINPNIFFERTGFSGGHEQGVIAVINKQYDAGVTWVSGTGKAEDGFDRGMLKNMMKKGLLDIDDLRVIWQSELIINGPHVVRKDLPESLKEELKHHNISLYHEDKVCFETTTSGLSLGYVSISHDDYKNVVEMRKFIKNQRRR